MSLKSDKWIEKMALEHGMIQPFVNHQVTHETRPDGVKKVISYGLSSYGYDIRVSNKFFIFTNALSTVVDPKNFHKEAFVEFVGDVCTIPPNSFILAQSVEYFKIPRRVMGTCYSKSTYARCGIVNCLTPLEPEWRGTLTLEISNDTPCPALVYANEGIAQIRFEESDEDCKVSYADRKGKYQDQIGITLAKVL